ncbi:MAG: peptidase domain-containing ABC transporter [Balneolaceae bacterium]
MNKKRISVRQHDITDCGAACLASVLAYYGYEIPLSKIRQYASTDKKGTNILGIIEAAEKLGLSGRGVRGEFESLSGIPLPAIAHVILKGELQHFAVIYRVSPQFIEIMDPMDGFLRKVPAGEFSDQWSGVLILLTPGKQFKKGNHRIPVRERLWFLVKPHKTVLFQALFGAAIYTLAGLSTAIYVQLIADYVLADANTNLLNLLASGMILLLLLQIFIGVMKRVFILKTGQLIDARLILGYYRHLLKLPQRFFDTMRIGEIISRINDAVKIRVFINDAAIQLSVNLFVILFSFGLMFTYYWKLGLVMATMIPVYFLIYLVINKLNKKTQRDVMENAAELESQLVESLRSVTTIKQFGLEQAAHAKTEVRFVSLLQSVYRSGLNSVASGSATTFTSGLFTILLLWTGSYMVLEGDLSIGELLSFYAIIGYFTGPVSELVEMNKTIQDAVIAGERLFEVMDLDREEEKKKIIPEPGLAGEIRFENIHFRYGSKGSVFRGFNVAIPAGKTTAFVGESGSGKTTIISILQKLYPVQQGRVLFGDLNIEHIDTRHLRSIIGIVPQQIHLFSGNIIDNIAVGQPEPDMGRLVAVCRNLGILDFIENLPDGFETHLGENGSSLSGGQKQRIAIARALYKKPEVLILDEGTSSLDPVSVMHVQKCIDLFRKDRKTVILIAHRLSTVSMADSICVLKNGRLAESGTHNRLLKAEGHYYALWKQQFPEVNGIKTEEMLKT